MPGTSAPSVYWFDYETFGRSPAWDRPVQFAGLRTDLELRPIGQPAVHWCRPPEDYLPDPGACRVTGLSPQDALDEGVPEAVFMRRVLAELGHPGTVSTGYNSVSFDDEFTRHALFRNLEDPYAHQWRDGNSRWDLLDVMRLARALRPEGIEWPVRDDGRPSNKLEHLAAANGIEHAHAHDALSDVEATLGIARLLKSRQPKLYAWAFEHRGKAAAGELLDLRERRAVLLAAGTVPADRHHLAAIVPIVRDATNRNAMLVLDLHTDPRELDGLDEEALRRRIFLRGDAPGDDTRLGLRSVKLNGCPALAPLATLRDADAERLGIDRAAIAERRDRLVAMLVADPGLEARIAVAMRRDWPEAEDVDGSLYGGPFIGTADRRRLARVLASDESALTSAAAQAGPFDDPRLGEMLWRYRARNFPETLSAGERHRWRGECALRLAHEDAPWLGWRGFERVIAEQEWRADEAPLRAALERYASTLRSRLSIPDDASA